MSRVKWVKDSFPDAPDDWWITCHVAPPLGYSIDKTEGGFQAWAADPLTEVRAGPLRKTLRAAHNDCKRHAKSLRKALVLFDRAKL